MCDMLAKRLMEFRVNIQWHKLQKHHRRGASTFYVPVQMCIALSLLCVDVHCPVLSLEKNTGKGRNSWERNFYGKAKWGATLWSLAARLTRWQPCMARGRQIFPLRHALQPRKKLGRRQGSDLQHGGNTASIGVLQNPHDKKAIHFANRKASSYKKWAWYSNKNRKMPKKSKKCFRVSWANAESVKFEILAEIEKKKNFSNVLTRTCTVLI